MMRLYGAIQKVEPQDDGTVRVHGIATSEAVDEQGEIVRADAIRAAIPDYMRFPALREMHQLSAAGTTLEAEVCDDGTTRIVAHVVDPVAVAKVRNQVYRGFSIGGRVTQRESGNPKTITGLVLNEISLVDRPANPEAIFDCWKAAMALDSASGFAQAFTTEADPIDPQQVPFNTPIQIWACGVPDHRHLAKAEALRCLTADAEEAGARNAQRSEAAAEQMDESAGVWSAEAGDNASSGSLAERLRDVGQNAARLMADLDWLRSALEPEATSKDEAAQEQAQLQAIVTELCDFLSSYANQAVEETPRETQAGESASATAMSEMPGAESPDLERVAMKAEQSRPDRGLLDIANTADALADDRIEKRALVKVLAEVVPMIEKLTKRVDEIARTPLPPLTMAKGTVSLSKQEDRGSNMGNGDSELSPEAIAAALAKMSKEEQTLTLIKASYATPIRIPGSAADQR
jgi:hypothetical protein